MEKLFDSIPNLTGPTVSLRKISINDLENIKKMLLCDDIYRYVPPFVPELQCNNDIEYFINTMCQELFNKKIEIILGIYSKYCNNELCGIFELFHYDEVKKQVSIGARLQKEYWNKGISREILALIIDYCFNKTDITTICASSIADNPLGNKSLERMGFSKIEDGILEDWGYSEKVCVNKYNIKKVKTNNHFNHNHY